MSEVLELTEEQDKIIDDWVYRICGAIRHLGNADAATPMGGMEALGAVLKDGLAGISSAIDEGLRAIADAIEGTPIDTSEIVKAINRLPMPSD